ncbi:hypothetical protein QBC33DRAFT_522306 [Phialemonium atrogriseum]|uniref:Uncharacterized protein n=1 Tax=Phialemonium atrogriseum TaxID=1093897 RepID=A0AAJ0FLK6_9PEZI|nr:uncharacterized protein QBC33DRAFT_522306 [Phialemonium atrogriseum]KAK1772721.1 hypothetical protein QBC33DRAFT_522306 [Phialemonium atrogriseum]
MRMPENLRGRGAGCAFRKGVSYEDMQVDMKHHENDEAGMSEYMTLWYSISHRIDDFRPGQEPLPGTYTCRLWVRFCNSASCP